MKAQTTDFLLVRRIAAEKRLRKIHAISFFTHAFNKSNVLVTNRLYTLLEKILLLTPLSFVKQSDSPLMHFFANHSQASHFKNNNPLKKRFR